MAPAAFRAPTALSPAAFRAPTALSPAAFRAPTALSLAAFRAPSTSPTLLLSLLETSPSSSPSFFVESADAAAADASAAIPLKPPFIFFLVLIFFLYNRFLLILTICLHNIQWEGIKRSN